MKCNGVQSYVPNALNNIDITGIAVGHGRSEGDRAHIEHYGQYVQDVIQTIEETKKQFPELPCYLMGHSMVINLKAVFYLIRKIKHPLLLFYSQST